MTGYVESGYVKFDFTDFAFNLVSAPDSAGIREAECVGHIIYIPD